MSKKSLGRIAWLLPLLVFCTPLVLPLAARHKPKIVAPPVPEGPADFNTIAYRIIANEWQTRGRMAEFSPRIETYLQYYKPDQELGDVATSDDYFLGRLKFSKTTENKVMEESFVPDTTAEWVRLGRGMLMSHIQMDQFAVEPLVVDENNFDLKHYSFHPVRWEFLGDIRCLAVDVNPRNPNAPAAFQGRIWVEDHNYAIVRLNGIRLNPPRWAFYIHFDCWRENLQPGLWLPVYVYSQESDRGKKLRYKSETRLWGYDLTAHRADQAWTRVLIDAPAPVRDASTSASDLTPVESQRQLNMEAERNVLDRLEKARLISPPGPVDQVLETVVNNLKVTNHLEGLMPVRCRVMMTSSLETFSLSYTIVVRVWPWSSCTNLLTLLWDKGSMPSIRSTTACWFPMKNCWRRWMLPVIVRKKPTPTPRALSF